MPIEQQFGDVTVTLGDDFVATAELHRPPDNYFDLTLIRSLADAYQALDADPRCRAIVLCAEGKHFCAGANLGGEGGGGGAGEALGGGPGALYREAIRLFEAGKPVVAGCRARRSAAGSDSPVRPISGSAARRPGSLRTSPGSASTPGSGSR